MSPVLNGSSMLEHFEHSDATEIRNGIMFDFYTGLPHIYHIINSQVWSFLILILISDVYALIHGKYLQSWVHPG